MFVTVVEDSLADEIGFVCSKGRVIWMGEADAIAVSVPCFVATICAVDTSFCATASAADWTAVACRTGTCSV